ncbi:MAG TPA: hypothetical protein VGH74_06680 [Planctomycetaceae bacterium]|jgi:uncharacterized membrane protein YqjE
MWSLLTALAVAFAAFCVWLTVRIVNRRERWAKWTLAVIVGVPVLYVASIGPAWRIYAHSKSPILGRCYYSFYSPIGLCCPDQMQPALDWYLGLFASD